ncbi:TATE DNA transposon [Leptomonas pyrrhocoris]|uniref:TATE DNA transposon n=1 Tax=Leptomonas pyrrhocoris TaxID=157538 RepID=A0A0M9G092_LEPPY|nr:TATE DNA transposon [Leptomonas pyrrhocoris]XP_015659644.1 TATE DNA transposon [Leptomonas pyrrhocoris]KPA79559.1 TATE DNA transposon [Leptomonas pyrrhocoris]KPA81205.1 TATE DNA transposon [Leptomonas pyrrhocoris]|eukprot:XP_015657998.1 TATE DNA transposon [Leptomonas pyrrhocoris]
MGLSISELHDEIRRMQGLPPGQIHGDPSRWPLHLKDVTLADIPAIKAMPSAKTSTAVDLNRALEYLEEGIFRFYHTARTISSTKMQQDDLLMAVRKGKFERCPVGFEQPLAADTHSMAVFWVPEHKGRRRLITQPALNGPVRKETVPKILRPSRLGIRQDLAAARYMFQIDFDAFYEAIPLPESVRNFFVFRVRSQFFRCCTLPTGARWSVAVGQAITSKIVDIDTPVFIHTMIDNILIAGRIGQEGAFCSAVRRIVERIKTARLKTTPSTEEVEALSDARLLDLAKGPNTFLGEEYEWREDRRVVRNSVKSVAKLKLALQKTAYTNRQFVSMIALIMYMLHTTRLNPAGSYYLMSVYRGIFAQVDRGRLWDEPLAFVSEKAKEALATLGEKLLRNDWWDIAPRIATPMDDSAYDLIVYTDASRMGWGAILSWRDGTTESMQQRWLSEGQPVNEEGLPAKGLATHFAAKHSAHSEPRAVGCILRELRREGIPRGTRNAIVTDHSAIAYAQRRLNGFGGIGRGYALNKLYEQTNQLFHEEGVVVLFFYINEKSNPADTFSRNFGADVEEGVLRRLIDGPSLPQLIQTAAFGLERAEVRTVGFEASRP